VFLEEYLKQNLKLEMFYAFAGPEVAVITDMSSYSKNGPMDKILIGSMNNTDLTGLKLFIE
jgi:hypothetical protein